MKFSYFKTYFIKRSRLKFSRTLKEQCLVNQFEMKKIFLKIVLLYLTSLQEGETSSVIQNSNACSNDDFYLRKVDRRIINLNEIPIVVPGIHNYQQCFAHCQKHRCFLFEFQRPGDEKKPGSCSIYPGQIELRPRLSTRFEEDENRSFFERAPCPLEEPEKSFRGTFKEAGNCSDVQDFGGTQSGLYEIAEIVNTSATSNQLQYILCDMNEFGGGWTTIMHNQGDITFASDWESYKKGFGDYRRSFWAGNDFIHQLTKNKDTELLVILKDNQTEIYYAHYKTFSIDDEASNYTLAIGQHTSLPGVTNLPPNALDQFYEHNGIPFSTKDKDSSSNTCATDYNVGWWFRGCYKVDLVSKVCGKATNYITGNAGIHWNDAKNQGWKGYCFTESTMLVRKRRY